MMAALYAIYDPHTDEDIAEFSDLCEVYAAMDTLTDRHRRVLGIRIAAEYRAQIKGGWAE